MSTQTRRVGWLVILAAAIGNGPFAQARLTEDSPLLHRDMVLLTQARNIQTETWCLTAPMTQVGAAGKKPLGLFPIGSGMCLYADLAQEFQPCQTSARGGRLSIGSAAGIRAKASHHRRRGYDLLEP